jgi:hypothetical protein
MDRRELDWLRMKKMLILLSRWINKKLREERKKKD